MIRAIPIWFTTLALALAAAPAAAAVSREASERSFEGAGLVGLHVINAGGRVTLEASADGRLHLRAVKVLRGTAAERSRLSSEIRVETSQDRGVLLVRVDYRRRTAIRVNLWDLVSGYELPRAEVELAIEVPRSLPVQVTSSSADVQATDLAGPLQITTSSGDVELRGPRGPAEITTSSGDVDARDVLAAGIRTNSGDVTIENVRGPLVLRTHSGDVTVRDARDSVSVSTISGDVQVERVACGVTVNTSSGEVVVSGAGGRVAIESASGDVRAEVVAPLALARVSTSSGDVTVRLGSGIGGILELHTSSGSLDVAAPVKVKEVDRHSLSAAFGRGVTPITLRTASGDIHVMSGGN